MIFFIPGSKIAIAYCNLEFQATHPDTGKESYVFNVGNVCTFNIIILKITYLHLCKRVNTQKNRKEENPGLLYIISY